MPSITTSTSSPDAMGPMPDGVPVAITSPGSSVITWEMKLTRSGTGKMRLDVLDFCLASPFKNDRTRRSEGSSSVSIHGPRGQNVSKLLARVHWPSLFWRVPGRYVVQAGVNRG